MSATLSAFAQVAAGRSRAKGLAAQATQTRIQARSDALEYKRQGVAVLDNILQTQAAIVARAGAGGIDPFSGSAKALQIYAKSRGADEYFLAVEGGTITTLMGEAQAGEYMRQASSAMKLGVLGAAVTLASAGQMQSTLGGPPAGVPQANTAGMGSQRGYFSR